MAYVWVFLGGGVGSVFRFMISRMVDYKEGTFPYATLLANIISSLILGILMGWIIKHGMSVQNKLLLLTGFCGGFSTFSTFSGESLHLFQKGQWGLASCYILVSIMTGIASVLIGVKIMSV